MSKWVVGEKCWSLRYGAGVISNYEEGARYPVATMHPFKTRRRTTVFEEEWTEEGRQYEFDECPTLFGSPEECEEWIKLVVMQKKAKESVAIRGGDIHLMNPNAIEEVKNDNASEGSPTLLKGVLCPSCED